MYDVQLTAEEKALDAIAAIEIRRRKLAALQDIETALQSNVDAETREVLLEWKAKTQL